MWECISGRSASHPIAAQSAEIDTLTLCVGVRGELENPGRFFKDKGCNVEKCYAVLKRKEVPLHHEEAITQFLFDKLAKEEKCLLFRSAGKQLMREGLSRKKSGNRILNDVIDKVNDHHQRWWLEIIAPGRCDLTLKFIRTTPPKPRFQGVFLSSFATLHGVVPEKRDLRVKDYFDLYVNFFGSYNPV